VIAVRPSTWLPLASDGTGRGQHEPAGSRQTRLSVEHFKFTRFAAPARVRTRTPHPPSLCSGGGVAATNAAPSERKVANQLRFCPWMAGICDFSGAGDGMSDDVHDEVLYVIRKPEDRFARVV